MSGKRSRKKQQKRQASILEQLEALYRPAAKTAGITDATDDELLARAAELGADLAASPFAARWAEVGDRAVRRSLARADFGRLDRLLRALRRNGPPRPLALLAQAVLDLAAGRLDGARATLAAADAVPGVSPTLLAELQALAQDEPGRRRKGTYPRGAAELFASLKALETRGFAPTAAERKSLARRLRALRNLAPEGPEIRRFLDAADAAERCLARLADLAALTTTLEGDAARARPALLAWIRRSGPALQATLDASLPPLLAPLRHAVALGWRSVLERVAERQGAPGLAALWSADPKLLAPHVDLSQGRGPESFRQRAEAQRLLEHKRYVKLAELLRSRGRTVTAAADLAAFWSLELWARSHWDDGPEDDEDLPPALDDPQPHRTLVRLGEMAGEIARRIPAEQRSGVARALAGELFELCDELGFCDHTAEAALSLLEHQPGDAGIGLLLAGLAGALAAGVPRTLRALQVYADRGLRVTAGDLPLARRLLTQVAWEAPPAIARTLDAVRPLFPVEAWPEIAELVAREMAGPFGKLLNEAVFTARQDPPWAKRLLSAARQGLDTLRPALSGTLGFAAAELVLAGWPDAIEPRLPPFLAAFPGWEAPAAALRLLVKAMGPIPSEVLSRTSGLLARAVIDRLDERWPLWCPGVPILAYAADRADLKRLEKKVRQLLAAPQIQGEEREDLAAALRAIEDIQTMRLLIELPRPRAKGAKPKKKRRRRSAGFPQLGLDFP